MSVPLASLTIVELDLLVEAEEEWARAKMTDWTPLYPASAFCVERNSKYFPTQRYADALLGAYVRRRKHGYEELRAAYAAAATATNQHVSTALQERHMVPKRVGRGSSPKRPAPPPRAQSARATSAVRSKTASTRRLVRSSRPSSGAPSVKAIASTETLPKLRRQLAPSAGSSYSVRHGSPARPTGAGATCKSAVRDAWSHVPKIQGHGRVALSLQPHNSDRTPLNSR